MDPQYDILKTGLDLDNFPFRVTGVVRYYSDTDPEYHIRVILMQNPFDQKYELGVTLFLNKGICAGVTKCFII